MSVVESRPSNPSVAAIHLAQAAEPPAAAVITIKNMKFQVPPGFSVKPGQRVDFVNNDRMPHTVTANNTNANGDPLFDIQISAGKTGSITFTAEMLGAQAFHCDFHPNMRATINVQADAADGGLDVFKSASKAKPVQPSSLAQGLSAPDAKVASARVRMGS